MFCNKPKHNKNVPAKRNRKRKKKSSYPQSDKKAKHTDQNHSFSLASAMSTWAENYTMATTWQLKHQVAYWKARAKSLEYENKVLHDVIKRNYLKGVHEEQNSEPTSSNNVVAESSESDEESAEQETECEEEEEDEEDEDGDELEVSEEFIDFLKKNAKYREDAKREKERLRAENEEESNEALMKKHKAESSEEKQIRLTGLYGSNWEKIMALETFTLCSFINECDKDLPKYWPNIPFNFDSYDTN